MVSIVVATASAAAAQVLIVDRIDIAPLRHLDLPLAFVVASSMARPANSAMIALVAGLIVDAFGWRLFGVHCLTYAAIGPTLAVVPAALPVGSRVAIGPMWGAGVAGAVSTAALVGVVAVFDGGLPPEAATAPVVAGLWAGPLAVAISTAAPRIGLLSRTPW